MELIATLTLAHLLADFPLQTNSIAFKKSKSFGGLLAHVAIHMATSWALLGFDYHLWLLISGLGTSHLLVDYVKLKSNPRSVPYFILDQAAHFAFILLISALSGPSQDRFHFLLPGELLYPSLVIAILLGLMVLVWLWANNLHDDQVQHSFPLRWGRRRLLELEQRAGFGLLCILGIGVMLMR